MDGHASEGARVARPREAVTQYKAQAKQAQAKRTLRSSKDVTHMRAAAQRRGAPAETDPAQPTAPPNIQQRRASLQQQRATTFNLLLGYSCDV
eukprot:5617251-Prymnesium_polylepis.2